MALTDLTKVNVSVPEPKKTTPTPDNTNTTTPKPDIPNIDTSKYDPRNPTTGKVNLPNYDVNNLAGNAASRKTTLPYDPRKDNGNIVQYAINGAKTPATTHTTGFVNRLGAQNKTGSSKTTEPTKTEHTTGFVNRLGSQNKNQPVVEETPTTGRNMPAFQADPTKWMDTPNTTGATRNGSQAGGKYTFTSTTDENGYMVSGIWNWNTDNDTRLQNLLDFESDFTWQTGATINPYMQEAANLYYDYVSLGRAFDNKVAELIEEATSAGLSADNPAIAPYIAAWKESAEAARANSETAKKIYDNLQERNTYFSAYDDDRLINVDDSSKYVDGNGRHIGTPEEINTKIEALQQIVDEYAQYEVYEKTHDANFSGLFGNLGNAPPVTTRSKQEALEAKKQIEDLKTDLTMAEEIRNDITAHNQNIVTARDYFFFDAKDGIESWKKEAERLESLKENSALTPEEKEAIDKKLAYVNTIIGEETDKAYIAKWSNASEGDIAKRIREIRYGKEWTDKFSPEETATIDKEIAAKEKQLEDLKAGNSYSVTQIANMTPAELSAKTKKDDRIKALEDELSALYDKRNSQNFNFYERPANREELGQLTADEMAELRILENIQRNHDIVALAETANQWKGKEEEWRDKALEAYTAASEKYQADIKEQEDHWRDAQTALGEFIPDIIDGDIRKYLPEDSEYADVWNYLIAKGVTNRAEAAQAIADHIESIQAGESEAKAEVAKAKNELAWANTAYTNSIKDQPDFTEKVAEGRKYIEEHGGLEGYRELLNTANNKADDNGWRGGFDNGVQYLVNAGMSKEEATEVLRMLGAFGVTAQTFTPRTEDLDGETTTGETLENLLNPAAKYALGERPGYFSDDQLNMFYYLLAEEGPASAAKYALSINNSINAQYQEMIEQNYEKIMSYDAANNPFDFYTGAIVQPWLTGAASLTAPVDMIKNWSQIATLGVNVNTSLPSLSAFGEMATGAYTQQLMESVPINPNLVNFLYNVYGSTVQSFEVMWTGTAMAKMLGLSDATALFSVFGKNVGAAQLAAGAVSDLTFFSSAAMSSFRDFTARGVDPETAWKASIAAGIAEAAFEHLSFDKLYEAKEVEFFTDWLDWAREVAVSAGIEGSEEVWTSLANHLTEYAILDDDSDFTTSVNKYMLEEGMDRDAATRATLWDFVKGLGTDFLAGAASGGISVGGRSALEFRGETTERKKIGHRLKQSVTGDNADASKAIGEYLSGYKYYDNETEKNYTHTQKRDIAKLQELAQKAAEGKATDVELGQMIALADSYDPKLVNDFIYNNPSAYMSVSPIRVVQVFQSANEVLLGKEAAEKLWQAQQANPDAFILNDFAKGLIEAGGKNEDGSDVIDQGMAETFSIVLSEVLSANEQTTDEHVQKVAAELAEKSPDAARYVLQFLQDRSKENTTIAPKEEATPIPTAEQARTGTTEEATETQPMPLPTAEEAKADVTPESGAETPTRTEGYERAEENGPKAPAEDIAATKAAHEAILSGMDIQLPDNMSKEEIGTLLAKTLSTAFSNAKTAYNNMRTRAAANFMAMAELTGVLDRDKTAEAVEVAPGRGVGVPKNFTEDMRSGQDSISYNGGDPVTRDAFVSSVTKGIDPFTGNERPPLSVEEANNNFDKLAFNTAGSSVFNTEENQYSASFVNYDMEKMSPIESEKKPRKRKTKGEEKAEGKEEGKKPKFKKKSKSSDTTGDTGLVSDQLIEQIEYLKERLNATVNGKFLYSEEVRADISAQIEAFENTLNQLKAATAAHEKATERREAESAAREESEAQAKEREKETADRIAEEEKALKELEEKRRAAHEKEEAARTERQAAQEAADKAEREHEAYVASIREQEEAAAKEFEERKAAAHAEEERTRAAMEEARKVADAKQAEYEKAVADEKAAKEKENARLQKQAHDRAEAWRKDEAAARERAEQLEQEHTRAVAELRAAEAAEKELEEKKAAAHAREETSRKEMEEAKAEAERAAKAHEQVVADLRAYEAEIAERTKALEEAKAVAAGQVKEENKPEEGVAPTTPQTTGTVQHVIPPNPKAQGGTPAGEPVPTGTVASGGTQHVLQPKAVVEAQSGVGPATEAMGTGEVEAAAEVEAAVEEVAEQIDEDKAEVEAEAEAERAIADPEAALEEVSAGLDAIEEKLDEVLSETAEAQEAYTAESVRDTVDITATESDYLEEDSEEVKATVYNRSWDDAWEDSEGNVTTRADYVAEQMSNGVSAARALDFFDQDLADIKTGDLIGKAYPGGKYSTNGKTGQHTTTEVEALSAARAEYAQADAELKRAKTDQQRAKAQNRYDRAAQRLEDLLGVSATDLGQAALSAKQAIEAEILSIDSQLDEMERFLQANPNRTREYERARQHLINLKNDAQRRYRAIAQAEKDYNKKRRQLDRLRNERYNYDSTQIGGTNGRSENENQTSGRNADVGNGVRSAESGGSGSGTAERNAASAGAGEARTAQTPQDILRLAGLSLNENGQVVFDSATMTDEDLDKLNVSQAVKDAVRRLRRNGVRRVVLTAGGLTINSTKQGTDGWHGNGIILCDISENNPERTLLHEYVHYMFEKLGVGRRHSFINACIDAIFLGREDLYNQMLLSYAPDYALAYKYVTTREEAENLKLEDLPYELVDRINEEIIADFYSGNTRLSDADPIEYVQAYSAFADDMRKRVRLVFEMSGMEKYARDQWAGAEHVPSDILDVSYFSDSTMDMPFGKQFEHRTVETPPLDGRNSLESMAAGANLAVLYSVDEDGTVTEMSYDQWLRRTSAKTPSLTKEELLTKFREGYANGSISATGLAYRGKKGVLTKLGKDDEISAEYMKKTPLGRMVTRALDNGFISENDAQSQLEFLANVLNMMKNYSDTGMVWEVVGSELFAAVKNNSDPQYGKTTDFSTVCKKTQAVLNVISRTMQLIDSGLSKEEIKYVYQAVGEAGESTPCPVCYVFSRWMGLGSVLDNIHQFQLLYGDVEGGAERALEVVNRLYPAILKEMGAAEKVEDDELDEEVEIDEEEDEESKKKKKTFGKAINLAQGKIDKKLNAALSYWAQYDEAAENIDTLRQKIASLEQKEKLTKAETTQLGKDKILLDTYDYILSKTKDEWNDQIREYAAQSEEFDAYKWLVLARVEDKGEGQFVLREGYADVPSDVLFDLNRGGLFAEKYPNTWKYRTSRGAGLGKAILPYSDARVGEVIQSIALADVKNVKIGEKNPFTKPSITKDATNIFKRAVKKIAAQNLIGGMRYQSTSDFRYEYASDYLMSFFEMQAIGANVQLYTKVVEAVDFFATVGCDVNLSVMPRESGVGVLTKEPDDWYENYDRYFTLSPDSTEKKPKYIKLQGKDNAPDFEPGKYYAIQYSNVTGVNGEAARHFVEKYDNVQMIMVGISSAHINACLDSDDITFVIPFHGSGNSTKDIQQLMNLLHEDISIESIKDFAPFESDFVTDTSLKDFREVREMIVSGKLMKPITSRTRSETERIDLNTITRLDKNGEQIPWVKNVLAKSERLRDLYRRFYLDSTTSDGVVNYSKLEEIYKAEDLRGLYDMPTIAETENKKTAYQRWQNFQNKYYLNGINECYHNFLSGRNTIEKIFPYEYWDKSLKQSEAKKNGDAFLEYCKELGIAPRFSGQSKKGSYDADGDFTGNPNYWKLLIDRPMYDNKGNYRAQRKINLSNLSEAKGFNFNDLTPATGELLFGDGGIISNQVNPSVEHNAVMSKRDDPTKVEDIAQASAEKILAARAKTAEADPTRRSVIGHDYASEKLIDQMMEDVRYKRGVVGESDIREAIDAGDYKTAANMLTKDTGDVLIETADGEATIVGPGAGSYSLSTDSTGRQLSEQQVEYFKNSQVRDELGRLLKLYHGATTWGYTVFNPEYSDDKISFFLTDSVPIARSYSGSREIRSLVNTAIASKDSPYKIAEYYQQLINANPYFQDTIIQYVDDGLISKERSKILKDYDKGLSELKSDFLALQENLPEDIKRTIQDYIKKISTAPQTKSDSNLLRDTVFSVQNFLGSLEDSWDDALWFDNEIDGIRSDFGRLILINDRISELRDIEKLDKNIYAKYDTNSTTPTYITEKYIEDEIGTVGSESRAIYPLYANITNPLIVDAKGKHWNQIQVSSDITEYLKTLSDSAHFSDLNAGETNTRGLARYAKDHGYNGVVIKNCIDIGPESSVSPSENPESTIVIAFDSNQIKDVENRNPTENPDFRYSIKTIKGSEKEYGLGVVFDSELLNTDRDWSDVATEFIKSMQGKQLNAYDVDTDAPVDLMIAPGYMWHKKSTKDKPSPTLGELLINSNDERRSVKTNKSRFLIHIPEAIQVLHSDHAFSRPAGPSHSFVDSKGWDYYRIYGQDTDGYIYTAIVNVAKGDFGNILYTITTYPHYIDRDPAFEGKEKEPNGASNSTMTSAKPTGMAASLGSDVIIPQTEEDSNKQNPVNSKDDYSLVPVNPIRPTTDAWSRTLTSDEVKERFPNFWDVTAAESEVRNPTQIKSTVSTYKKIYNMLRDEGFDGTILDASSGLGYGTRAGREEYGFDVDDIEPFPDASYKPNYTDYSTLDKTYDVIISNAVLNVLPQDVRDNLVVKMGQMLNPGGRMFINVRGDDVNTLANNASNTRINNREWYVDGTGSYQKGFTKPELKAYLEDALGPDYTVTTSNKFGGVSVIVEKSPEGVYSLSPSGEKKYGLNFRDSTGELLERVFATGENRKKYETRTYTDKRGHGAIKGIYLNKPIGIIQTTGKGRGKLVGEWELGDGEPKDSQWLNDHKDELGNNGTKFEAKAGEVKWVYPIKWAKRVTPRTVYSWGPQARSIEEEWLSPISDAVDMFGDPVDTPGIDLSQATRSDLSDRVVYTNDKALYRTEDGQTVVLDNIGLDSPEAQYITYLEAMRNAERSAAQPYTIPVNTGNGNNGYSNSEQSAGLRRGQTEIPAKYQEEPSRRHGGIPERNATSGSPSTAPEGVSYSLSTTDRKYFDALDNNDMATAAGLVESAAKKAGYKKTAYHGTRKAGFNEFWEVSRHELGVHFGTKDAANVFFKGKNGKNGNKPGVYEVYLRMKNTLKTPDVWGEYFALKDLVNDLDDMIEYGYVGKIPNTKWTKADSKKLKAVLVNNDDYRKYLEACEAADRAFEEYSDNYGLEGSEALEEAYDALSRDANRAARNYLLNLGYDSVRYINEVEDRGNESYIVLNPENIKSTDTVTYDDEGNIIPLSERFNDETRDIRYSLTPRKTEPGGYPITTIYNADGEVIASTDMFPIGDFRRDLVKAIDKNEITRIENLVNSKLKSSEPISRKVQDQVRQLIEQNDRLSDPIKRAMMDKLNDLIEEYGEKPHSDKDKYPDRVLPDAVDDDTKTRKFVNTSYRTTDKEAFADLLAFRTLTDAAMSYVPISNKQTINDAMAIFKSYGANAPEKVMRHIENLLVTHSVPSATDIALGEIAITELVAEGQYDKAGKLVADMSIIGTKLGQAIQAMNILKSLTPMGRLYYLQRVVNELNHQYEKRINDPNDRMNMITISSKLRDQLLGAGSLAELDAATEALKDDIARQIPPTWTDKWNAWRYLAMLGNPKTHIRNMFGNAAFAPAIVLKDMFARRLENNTKWIDPSARMRSAKADLSKDSNYMKFAEADWGIMQKVVAGEAGGNKWSDSNDILQRRHVFGEGTLLDRLEKYNGKKLGDEDIWFMHKYYVRALAEALQARGVSEDRILDQEEKFGVTPEEAAVLNECRQWAANEAQRNTYHDANSAAQTLNKLKRSSPVAGFLLEGLMPFTTTPANILKRGIEYSPIGLISSIIQLNKDLRSGEFTTSQCLDRLAAGMSGTMITILGVLLASLGLLRGAGPDDKDEAKFEKLQGHQNWSLEFGKLSYTIDWMAPTALPLFTGCGLFDLIAGENDINVLDVPMLLSKLANPMMSLSMLDGIESTLSSLSYADDTDKVSTLLLAMATSYLAQGMPTIFGQAARSMDKDRRQTYKDPNKTGFASTLDQFVQTSIQAKVPGWENKKMAFVDEWGRTDSADSALDWVLRTVENFFSPGYGNIINETPVDAELARLVDATGETAILPDKLAKTFHTPNGDHKMTADEYEKGNKINGQTYYALLDDIFLSDEYNALDDENKLKVIKEAKEYSAACARLNVDSSYERDRWHEIADKIGASTYILLKSDIDDNKSKEKLFGMLVNNPNLTTLQKSTLMGTKFSAPSEIRSTVDNAYVYQMTDEDDEAIAEIYQGLLDQALPQLLNDEIYISSNQTEKGRLTQDLDKDIRDQAIQIYSDLLDRSGRVWEVGRASTLGKEAFSKVLDLHDGDVNAQADYISSMYKGDRTIVNPSHEGYNMEIDDWQKRKLETEFKPVWRDAYNDLLNSKEFKNAPSREYQDTLIASAYNKAVSDFESSKASEWYTEGKYVGESLRKASSYSWDDAANIARTISSDPAKQAEWLMETWSADNHIDVPGRAGYVVDLNEAQKNERRGMLMTAGVNAYVAEWNKPGFDLLTKEQQDERLKGAVNAAVAIVNENYASTLIDRGTASVSVDKGMNRDTFYQYLTESSMSEEEKMQAFIDKYTGGTLKNWDAKDSRIEAYEQYVTDNWIKNATPEQLEKLHSKAGTASSKVARAPYGARTLGDVPEYPYQFDPATLMKGYEGAGSAPSTVGGTATTPVSTPSVSTTELRYIIPSNDEYLRKYGVIPARTK